VPFAREGSEVAGEREARLRAVPTETVVTSSGVRLHVREWPAGGGERATALLAHGLASTSRIWDLVAPRLARAGVRAVAFDQRGHGLSDMPASGYGFDHTVEDAAEVIRALRLKRAIAVGHSWGANVVLELAVRQPRIVRGAVLIDGGFMRMQDRFDWAAAREALTPPDIDGMTVDEFLSWPRRHLGGTLRITPQIEEVFLSLVRVDARGRIRRRLPVAKHVRILRALWEQDAPALLRRVRVPTLVLAVRSVPGTPDSAGFMDDKRRAAGAVKAIGPPVRFEWIDGIHDVPLQRPAAVARRIIDMPSAS
jgi:pimeloyl-ACP methyl ester carboxylesterase